MHNDRASMLEQWELSDEDAIRNEIRRSLDTISSGETDSGAGLFVGGKGRHGSVLDRF